MNNTFFYNKLLIPISIRFKRIYEKYYFRRCRRRNKNKDFSLFSPNCFAGIIYHRLGMEFKSPTINMLFPVKKQYLKFISNLKYYLRQNLEFIDDDKYSCPVAMLDDVKIVFNHDKDENVIRENWNRRKKRVNFDNLYFIFDDLADAEYSDLIEFNKIESKGKVIFTAKDYGDLKNTVIISKYKKEGNLKAYLLDKSIWTGKNVADKDFDFVKWLNESV